MIIFQFPKHGYLLQRSHSDLLRLKRSLQRAFESRPTLLESQTLIDEFAIFKLGPAAEAFILESLSAPSLANHLQPRHRRGLSRFG
jgi:hypothetical protein